MTARRDPVDAAPARAPHSTNRRRLLVAMTVTGDAAHEIDGYRRALGGSGLGRIDPHVTLVPPVNVRDEELVDVLRLLRAVAADEPAEVALGPARTFAPRTPVVYLEVDGDTARIADLHRRLSVPPLVPTVVRPERPFVPHVTIGGRVDKPLIAATLSLLAKFKLEVVLSTVVLCEQDEVAPRHPWRVIADVVLGSGTTVGRGGRELDFVGSTILDPEAAAWADATPGEDLPDEDEMGHPGGDPFVLAAYAAERPVGVVVGSVRGSVAGIRRLRVAADRRDEGIGGQLVRATERAAAARGCARVTFVAVADGPVKAFLAHLGYAREAVFVGDGSAEPHVKLVRSVV